jgi:hypothetical protein
VGEREGEGGLGAAWSSVAVWRRRDGARSSVAGCSARQHDEAVGAALTGGTGSTVRLIQFSN